MTPLKTYSHLTAKKRIPTEYELVCSKLLYYTAKGFEVDVPLKDWYRKYQQDSALKCDDWEAFSDPRETTYTRYTELQSKKEIFVDGVFEAVEESGRDKMLGDAWFSIFENFVAPLRYPGHGLQMVASYIGQMAPSGKITVAAMFQAADEMRRVQRIAYRIGQLRLVRPDVGNSSLSLWKSGKCWQPLRECIEKLLVTYDWAEAFVALNLVLKPFMIELMMNGLRTLAQENGDPALPEIFYSLNEDSLWHKQWSQALIQTALRAKPGNAQVIREWIEKWHGPASRAVSALGEAMGRPLNTARADIERFK